MLWKSQEIQCNKYLVDFVSILKASYQSRSHLLPRFFIIIFSLFYNYKNNKIGQLANLRSIHGHHNLNKLESIVPEDAFTQVAAFLVDQFLRKRLL